LIAVHSRFTVAGKYMKVSLLVLLLAPQIVTQAPAHHVNSAELVGLAETAHANRAACGPLAMWFSLRQLGHVVDAQELVELAAPSEKGVSLNKVLELADAYGRNARAIQTSKTRLSLLPTPAILVVDRGKHCMVCSQFDSTFERAKVFEPTTMELTWIDTDDLARQWTGEAIVFSDPAPSQTALMATTCFVMLAVVGPTVILVRSGGRSRNARKGITLVELSAVISIVGLLLALLLPAVQQARESGRAARCRSNLAQIGIALLNYEQQFHVLPPAVVWKPAGEPLGQSIAAPGSVDRVSLGLVSSQEPDRVYANWLVTLLPFLDEQPLYDSFDLDRPLCDAANSQSRATSLPILLCPTDSAGEGPFLRAGLENVDQAYARGNYAINGGSNQRCLMQLSRRKVNCKEGVSVNGTSLERDTSQVWGNGVAGVNRSMRLKEFARGTSKLIGVEEVRAGTHSLDRRGVWALGFVGSSVTACHGLFGNNGPNIGKDAIQGCTQVADQVPDLEQLGMPCLKSKTDPRLEISERATARSLHPGGVHVLMVDGSAHFLSDTIDKRVWHNLHSRNHTEQIEF
jgi:prepilin-type processing-associated H-X9-DG protein